MKILYELLGNVLTAIEPRNERARTWLDKLILRAHSHTQPNLNPIIARASFEILRNDFQFFRITQGADAHQQQELYRQVEHLFAQLEHSTAMPYDDPRSTPTPNMINDRVADAARVAYPQAVSTVA